MRENCHDGEYHVGSVATTEPHAHEAKKKRIFTKECKIVSMLSLVICYFFVEMFVGYMYNSLALVADACHMLSDGLCLVVALVAIKISKRSIDDKVLSEQNTFGWGRSEILGSLINAIFLLALCVIIILESIQKFIQPEPVEQPLRVAWVGLGGLVMNVIGLFMFWGDGTGHGHSHGGGGGDHGHSHGHSREEGEHGHSHENSENSENCESSGSGENTPDLSKQAEQLNMRGILLHVMGDFLGSIVVVLSAALMYFYNNCDSDDISKCAFHNGAVECGEYLDKNGLNESTIEEFFNKSFVPNYESVINLMYPPVSVHWTLYVDPITSLILTMLILFTTLKLLRVPIMILLQTVPSSIDVEKLKKEVIETVKGEYNAIIKIHDLHIWTLSGNQFVGTVHIKLMNCDLQNFNQIVKDARKIFHNYGVHHLTIQPEFKGTDDQSSNGESSIGGLNYDEFKSEECLLVCCDEAKTCEKKQ